MAQAWFDKARPTIGAALQDYGYGLATGGFKNGFGNAAQRGAQMQPYRDQQAQQREQAAKDVATQNKTLEWLQQKAATDPRFGDLIAGVQGGELSVGDAWQAGMQLAQPAKAPQPIEINGQLVDPSTGKVIGDYRDPQDMAGGDDPASIQEYKFYANEAMKAGEAPMSYLDWRKGSNQTVRAGLGQPIPLRNKQTGETVPFMPMSDGTYMNPLTQQQADDSWEFDPAYIAAQKAAGTAYGTQQGGAQFNLPKAGQDVGFELQNIDAIKNDTKGLEDTFGKIGGVFPQQWNPIVDPNSPRATFKTRLDQVVGQNFLGAYSTLRGAGAITEAEGAKAQDAMGRLSTAQSEDSFKQALTDLETVLKAGYARMSQQANTPYQGAVQPGASQQGSAVDYRSKYGLE